ncbi:hypothetical protein V6N11_067532 [Hibiscus sabdariffa]|uniref:Uncharacterized protein n=1 Tax=Hibiscus sabdariffa TaxID=183260 RepID=A0ABR2SRW1_9ROSI
MPNGNPPQGGTFTWSNQRCEDNSILEKLDRTIVSPEWSSVFPKASGIVDVSLASDHALIILFLQGLGKKVKKGFKFESKWLLGNECFQKVKEGWNTPSPHGNFKMFGKNLNRTRTKLIKWSRVKFGRSRKSVDEMIEKIKML